MFPQAEAECAEKASEVTSGAVRQVQSMIDVPRTLNYRRSKGARRPDAEEGKQERFESDRQMENSRGNVNAMIYSTVSSLQCDCAVELWAVIASQEDHFHWLNGRSTSQKRTLFLAET